MAFDYDLFVIGGGSGGVRAARLASSEAGAKVALAEEFRMGGTCVIRGCVPKKLMVFASTYKEMTVDAAAYGWDINIGDFNWPTFKGKLDLELDRLENAYRNTLARAEVEVFNERATIDDAHTIKLASGKTVTAKHILVATGGYPVKPDVLGADLAITSNEIFNLKELPKSVLIVGGGFIACEFACILNGLGVKVTQFYRGEQILRGFDLEATSMISDEMVKQGIKLRLGDNAASLEQTDGGILVTDTQGGTETYDQVMFATGRTPNTNGLGLEALGLELGRGGAIPVDKFSQTKVPSIFAVGDVTNRINLTPVAIREGAAFVETIFHGRPTSFDHDQVPSAVFTQPELGTVGMSEEEAAASEAIEVYSAAFKPMQSSFAGRDSKVLMKLVVSKATQRVLGCHIVADQAGEMIQLAGIAVKMGATKAQFDATCAVHPTMAEELVTMKTPVRTT